MEARTYTQTGLRAPRHVLVTNDFPPKVGGIQNYLWELWRRLPPKSFSVLTHFHSEASAFDSSQRFRIVRSSSHVLLPTPKLRSEVLREARETGAELLLFDPIWLIGSLGPSLGFPYGVVLHGSETTSLLRIPWLRKRLNIVFARAAVVISASNWATETIQRHCPAASDFVYIPPGVDTERFQPLSERRRAAVRRSLGLSPKHVLLLCVSRLVPRKGMDMFIEAVARLAPGRPDLKAAIAGGGRDKKRLKALIKRRSAPVRLLGAVGEEYLPDLYGATDVFAMLCRDRWKGVEKEGFGIVFLEAAAAGVPQVAGASGGSPEAVAHGKTGLVVDDPSNPEDVVEAIAALVDDPDLRRRMGKAARARAVEEFSCDHMARRLSEALRELSWRRRVS